MRSPASELAQLDESALRRRLRRVIGAQSVELDVDGRKVINFSSNDYLGLADDPALKAAYAENIQRHGAGSGASRLICGTMDAHLEFEEALAAFKHTEAALTFSSGYATAVGTLTGLLQKGDVVILDKLCHASLIDGARLSGATIRVFPHNRIDRLTSHLDWAKSQITDDSRVIVVTESIFSMDGDEAPLIEIVTAVRETLPEALLLVDEAHAFGINGPEGRGLAAEVGVDDQVDLHMGTLSKAAGLSGGYLCASRDLIDLLINRARSFIYSTAPTPALSATASTVLEFFQSTKGTETRTRLGKNIAQFKSLFPEENGSRSAIQPHILGESEVALAAAETFAEQGILAPAIRFPTVARDAARLRFTLSAAHSDDHLQALAKVLSQL